MRANLARFGVARGGAALLLLGLSATAACSTATPNRYRSFREDWRNSEPLARTADLGDSLFEGSATLDRGELIRAVLERNPSVRAARYAWRASLERYPQVASFDDPMIGAGLAPLSVGSSIVTDAPKFDLSQKFPFPGKLRLRGEAALAEAEAASHDYTAVRLRLAAMASFLYDDYTLAARSLEINAEHVALLEEFQGIAAARYEAGMASQQDPIQAEVQLTHALHREVVLATAQRVTLEQINALLHRLPTASLPPPPASVSIPPAIETAADELIETALADKPEVSAASARVTAEQSRVDLARREYFPDVTLVGSYNRVMQEPDLQPFVGIQMNVPLQLGRRKAAVQEALARTELARSQKDAIEDDVRFSVQSGVERLEEARHIELLFRDQLEPAARDNVSAARAGFETGRNSFLALIDAERNLLDVELGHAGALADLGRRAADLDRALGRIPSSVR